MTEEYLIRNNRKNIQFSWTNNSPEQSYSCRQFGIRFPDEFEIIRDTRFEFYACMKNPDEPERNLISIKPGRMTTLQTFGMDIHSEELLLAILHLNALKGMGGLLWIADRSESFTVEAGGCELLCFYDQKGQTASFYVYMVFRNAVRPVIITLDSLNGSVGDREKGLVLELVSHLTLYQEPFQKLPELTDVQFTKGILILQVTNQWKKLLTQYMEELEHIFFINLQIVQQKIRGVQKKETFSREMAEGWYRQELKHYASMVENLMEQTAEFLRCVYNSNQDNPVFYELVSDMEVFLLKNRKVSVSIDHEEKSEPVRNAENVWAKWRYCNLRREMAQVSERRDVLADMDRSLQSDYGKAKRELEELEAHLKKAEKQLEEKRKINRLAGEEELRKINEILREKELELGECYAQQKALKGQIQNLSFLHRIQKEQLNRQLSQVMIRAGKIRTETDNLEDRKVSIEAREEEGLDNLADQVRSYRMRFRLKSEEVGKAGKIAERNRKLLEEKQGELQTLQEEFRKVALTARQSIR